MSDGQLPSNDHVLRPRTMSISDRLDEFLEKHALSPTEALVGRDPTRPKADGINAITCAACKQVECLTRDYCRCGHYLRGQLEGEFLAWFSRLAEEHRQLEKSFEMRSRALAWVYVAALPLVAAPLIHVALASSAMSLLHACCIAAGLGIMGLGAVIESKFRKPIELSLDRLNTSNFEDFLEVRTLQFFEAGN